MTASPKASICIPTFNQAHFLHSSLKSALAQSYDDFEVVVSINHCTDHTEEVVQMYAGDPRVRVVRPPHFMPVDEHFRFALAQASGTYINFLSTDDELYPDFLSTQIDTLESNPNIVLSFTAGEMIDETGRLLQVNRAVSGSYVRRGYDELPRYIFHLRATGIALLMRRSAYEAMGGVRTPIPDWEACVKLLCLGDIAYHDRVLAKVRIWTNTARVAQRVAMMDGTARFFDDVEEFVVARYPELKPTVQRSRRMRARIEVGLLDDLGEHREAARRHILRISNAPSVKLKLFAWERLHMRPWFVVYGRTDAWLRVQAKRLVWKGRSFLRRA